MQKRYIWLGIYVRYIGSIYNIDFTYCNLWHYNAKPGKSTAEVIGNISEYQNFKFSKNVQKLINIAPGI